MMINKNILKREDRNHPGLIWQVDSEKIHTCLLSLQRVIRLLILWHQEHFLHSRQVLDPSLVEQTVFQCVAGFQLCLKTFLSA